MLSDGVLVTLAVAAVRWSEGMVLQQQARQQPNTLSLPSSEYYDDYEDYYDYYYDEPLPSGPTRRPSPAPTSRPAPAPASRPAPAPASRPAPAPASRTAPAPTPSTRLALPDYADYYQDYEDSLPGGPVKEPPLPSGPTRRPGQATTLRPGSRRTTLSPALNQFLTLPLLTTRRPRNKQQGRNGATAQQVQAQFGPGHFIAPPAVNAGALPLANSALPAGLFPPFNILPQTRE